jgi:hypothetical protein
VPTAPTHRASSAREATKPAPYVAPQDKRRDGLRWQTRVRMMNQENVQPVL